VLPERDETDLILLEVAERRAMPVLGICFGMQSINVARGGSLIQDLASQMPEAIKHEQGQTINRPSHHIRIETGSLLAELAGGETARVNSSHHQAVGKIGRDLRAIARAPDGVIEAIIDPRPDRFALGVQWHPEIGWEKDKFSQAIFNKFIEAAR
jgi:putative glutamine amidotransferase